MTVTQHIREHLLRRLHFPEVKAVISVEELRNTEWSVQFETYMRNRLIMGAYRYGCLGDPGKPQYDRCEYIKRKLDEYIVTGNLECLVDISNLSLCEFVEGNHPLRHFSAIDNHDQHARRIN